MFTSLDILCHCYIGGRTVCIINQHKLLAVPWFIWEISCHHQHRQPPPPTSSTAAPPSFATSLYSPAMHLGLFVVVIIIPPPSSTDWIAESVRNRSWMTGGWLAEWVASLLVCMGLAGRSVHPTQTLHSLASDFIELWILPAVVFLICILFNCSSSDVSTTVFIYHRNRSTHPHQELLANETEIASRIHRIN